jgi:hypothetical protein
MKMTKIISYIHLFGCIGWSIVGFVFLIGGLINGEHIDILLFFLFSAVYATTVSGIYLFIVGRKKQLENIKIPTLKTKIISYIHLLGCIGWSILGFYGLMEGLRPEQCLFVLAVFVTTSSGIYLFVIQFAVCRQGLARLWKVKKLTVLWIGITIIVLMCLFPPWGRGGRFFGYAFLFTGRFNTGMGSRATRGREWGEIDLVRLIIQCVIVGLITGALLYTLNSKKSEDGGK